MPRDSSPASDVSFVIPNRRDGLSRLPSTNQRMQRLCRLWRCRSLQCFFPCPGRRNARCRNSGRQSSVAESLRNRHLLRRGDRFPHGAVFDPRPNRRNFLRNLPTETTADERSVTTSARLFASISSTPPWSSRTQLTSAGSRLFAKPLASRLKTLSTHLADWASKDRDALLCQLNSYLGAKEGAA